MVEKECDRVIAINCALLQQKYLGAEGEGGQMGRGKGAKDRNVFD